MFNAQQEKLRENDPVKVVLSWSSSPFIYTGVDSRTQKVPNPDYHPVICLTETGKFVDCDGRPIPLTRVPAYLREAAKPPKAAAPPTPREMNLAEAMQESETPADPAPKPARKRGRPKKAA